MRKSSKGNLEGHYMITSNLGDTVLCWLLKCIRLFYTWDCTGVYETSSVQGQHQLFVFLKEDDKATTQNTVNACLSFTCYIEDETNLHCKAWLSDLKFLKENKKKSIQVSGTMSSVLLSTNQAPGSSFTAISLHRAKETKSASISCSWSSKGRIQFFSLLLRSLHCTIFP